MKDDFKQTTYKTNINKEPSIDVLKYQLTSNKRDAKKNVIIAALLVGIFAFTAGYIVSDMSNTEVNALTRTNASLREENASLKAQASSENQ